jgi:RNA polymerase sigma-70 factor (ECF subfamily)
MPRANPYTDSDVDHLLVLRLKTGDLHAFNELVAAYNERVVNFSARILCDMDEAEDIAQIVFVKAFGALGQFRFASKLSTWLYAIARNLCLNELERRSRQRWLTPLDDADWAHAVEHLEDTRNRTAPDLLLHAELVEKIEEVLAALPDSQRAALYLTCEGDRSYDQIAQTMGVTVSAAKSLIHRGRRTLKRRLRAYWSGAFSLGMVSSDQIIGKPSTHTI